MRCNFSSPRSIEALNREFHPERVVECVAAAEVEPVVIELTPLQMVALLRMNRSTLCRGIASNLQAEAQDAPSIFDYRALVAHQLCYLPEDERFHSITPKGAALANEIARAKAKEFGIHIMLPGGFTGAQQSFACTCGKWNVSYPRGVNTDSNAYRGWLWHVAQASPTRHAESA